VSREERVSNLAVIVGLIFVTPSVIAWLFILFNDVCTGRGTRSGVSDWDYEIRFYFIEREIYDEKSLLVSSQDWDYPVRQFFMFLATPIYFRSRLGQRRVNYVVREVSDGRGRA
jgi:hypothetical protein